jgi:ribosomal protein S18 acetylase RimI-like enzyme
MQRSGKVADKADGTTVRDATEADLDRIAELWAEMIDLHHDLDEHFWVRKPDGQKIFRGWMAEAVDDEKRVLIVAEVAGEVAGFVHGQLVDAPPPMEGRISGSITDVSVGFDYRGKGVGKKMMAAVLEWFTARGAEEVTLLAAVKNDCAVAFYEALGFERHTITMWKSLG